MKPIRIQRKRTKGRKMPERLLGDFLPACGCGPRTICREHYVKAIGVLGDPRECVTIFLGGDLEIVPNRDEYSEKKENI